MIPNLIDPNNEALRPDNPYANAIQIVFDDGTSMLERFKPFFTKNPNDRYYTTINDQNLSDIAFEAYGNSKYWWVIADANDIDLPFELEGGTTLLIPDLEQLKIEEIV